MTNPLTTEVKASLEANPYHNEHFVAITFPDSFTFRVWTGSNEYTLGGNVYYPTSNARGGIGSVSDIPETSDLSAQPVVLTLANLPTDLMAALRNYQHQGSPVSIMEAQFNGPDLLPDAYSIYSGRIDTMSFLAAETLTITINVTGLLQMIFRGPDGRRRTQADQNQIFPPGVDVKAPDGTVLIAAASFTDGDLGLAYVAQLKENIPWGVRDNVASRQGLTNI